MSPAGMSPWYAYSRNTHTGFQEPTLNPVVFCLFFFIKETNKTKYTIEIDGSGGKSQPNKLTATLDNLEVWSI